MADFAHLIYGTAQGAAQSVGKGAVEGIVQGAQLAMQREQLEMKKQELAQHNKSLAEAKLGKLYDYVGNAKNYSGSARNNYLKSALGYRNQLGIDANAIPDDQILGLGFDENMGRMATIEGEVAAGRMTKSEALHMANNPEAFSKIVPTPLEAIGKDTDFSNAEKEFMTRQNALRVAEIAGGSRVAAAKVPGEGAGEKALSIDLAKKFGDYMAGGGRAGMRSSVEKLNNAANALETGKVVTGGVTTVIPGFKNDDAQSVVNPKMVAMRTEAQSAVNAILKQTLGGAFTEKEGERILNQIWDDRQPPKENARKIRAKIKELELGVRSAEDQYVKQGFLEPEVKKASPEQRKKAQDYLRLYPNAPDAAKARAILKGE